MDISRDNWHECHKTRGKRKTYHRKQNMSWEALWPTGRSPPPRPHALRLDTDSFSQGSGCCTHETRTFCVVYNAPNSRPPRPAPVRTASRSLAHTHCITLSGSHSLCHARWLTLAASHLLGHAHCITLTASRSLTAYRTDWGAPGGTTWGARQAQLTPKEEGV